MEIRQLGAGQNLGVSTASMVLANYNHPLCVLVWFLLFTGPKAKWTKNKSCNLWGWS